jgi:hypothetical protein
VNTHANLASRARCPSVWLCRPTVSFFTTETLFVYTERESIVPQPSAGPTAWPAASLLVPLTRIRLAVHLLDNGAEVWPWKWEQGDRAGSILRPACGTSRTTLGLTMLSKWQS